MSKKIKILGISGSLRKGSYNTALLRAAREFLPQDTEIEIYVPGDLPLFNQDIESPIPPVVKKLKNKIAKADAIIFATPEHNFTTTAVLKNAIEWGSRPLGDNSWDRKPTAIMSASPGMTAGARAQLNLRHNLLHINVYVLNRPHFMVPKANEKFDSGGNLIDEHTKEKIKELLNALVTWTKRLSG